MFWDKKKPKKKRRRKKRSSSSTKTLKTLEQFVVEEIEVDAIAEPLGGHKLKSKTKFRDRDYTPPEWLQDIKVMSGWLMLCVFLIAASFYGRPLWSVDETRVLAIAWEMWLQQSWWLPMLNGQAYTEGPLLYWFILAGWKLIGVVDWWPRLVPAVFALLNLILLGRLASHLWPGRKEIRRYGPLVLLSSFFWAFYSTLTLGDLITVFAVQLSLLAMLRMWRMRSKHMWYVLLTLAMTMGMLNMGLLFLIYIMPIAIIAPFWAVERPSINWGRWYGGLIKALVVSLGLTIAWVMTASANLDSGVDYIHRFLTGESVYRGLEFFAQGQPWWWYLLLIMLLALPWGIWPLLWMRLWYIRADKMNAGLLFCIIWGATTVALLSVLGFRQPQILLPAYSAFSLTVTYLLFDDDLSSLGQDRGYSTMSIPIILIGGVLIMMPLFPKIEHLPEFLWQLSPFVGFGTIALGVLLAWLPVPEIKRRILNLAIGSLVITTAVIVAVGWKFGPTFDTTKVGQYIAKAQQQDIPVAHVGDYHGQFHFSGRLQKPIQVVSKDRASFWAASNRNGLLLTYENVWRPRVGSRTQPLFVTVYRDTTLQIWAAKDVK